MAGNGKINHGKGMFGAVALTFPFQNIEIGEKNILYGVPSEVKRRFSEEIEKLLERKSGDGIGLNR